MNKEEFIKRYGRVAYAEKLQQANDWNAQHRERENARSKAWDENHPEEAIARHQESYRKGGRFYEAKKLYGATGIQGERNAIRQKHRHCYRPIKRIIAPDSQIHHEWILGTADFRGVALVERGQHMHGIIDVIKILDGEITLLTEEEVKKGGE